MNIRVFSSLLLVAGLAVSVQALKADLPPAPDLAAPPILSEAKVWLDAWDYSTVQTDDDGFVTNWLSKGDAAYNAKPYATAVSGKMGVTNGVPAFLMGEVGSGIDLAFKYMTDIRTVFWVMDTLPYEKAKESDADYKAKLERTRFLGYSMYEESASFSRSAGNQACSTGMLRRFMRGPGSATPISGPGISVAGAGVTTPRLRMARRSM